MQQWAVATQFKPGGLIDKSHCLYEPSAFGRFLTWLHGRARSVKVEKKENAIPQITR